MSEPVNMFVGSLKQNKYEAWTKPLLVVSILIFVLIRLIKGPGGDGMPETYSSFFFFCSLGAFLIYKKAWNADEKLNIMTVFIAAYIVRFLAAIIFFPYFTSIHWSDHWMYIKIGQVLADNWNMNIFKMISSMNMLGHQGFYIYVAAHLKIDPNPIFIVPTNTFFSAYSTVILYNICRNFLKTLNERRILLAGALLFAFFPRSIFYSTVLLKEALTCFLCLLFIDNMLEFFYGRFLKPALLMAVAIIPLFVIRAYLVPILFLTLVISAFFYRDFTQRGKKLAFGLIAFFIILFVGIVLYLPKSHFFGFAFYAIKAIGVKGILPALMDTRRDFASAGSTSYAQLKYSSIGQMLIYFPVGLLRTFVTPIQWFREGKDVRDTVEVYMAIFWYLLMPFVFAGFYDMVKRKLKAALPVIIYVVLVILFVSIIFMGSQTRHNNLMYPFLCLFAAYGISRWRSILPFTLAVYFVLGTIVTATEVSIKGTLVLLMPSCLAIMIGVLVCLARAENQRQKLTIK